MLENSLSYEEFMEIVQLITLGAGLKFKEINEIGELSNNYGVILTD